MAYAYLDTNILIAAAQGAKVLYVLDEDYPHLTKATLQGVLSELDEIQEHGTGAQKREAVLAKRLITQQDLKVVSHSTSYVDDALLEQASSQDVLVTLDRALQLRARKEGLRVLTLAKGRLRFVA